ncbi:MAG: hypothetical protein WC718_11935 [Phycisphaerales bacterium]
MNSYDPDRAPPPGEWLGLDEGVRIALVEDFHRRARIRVPREAVHATVHVTVENQLAMELPVVVDTLARLCSEGLGRHEAIHAIGLVLMEHIQHQLAAPSWAPNPAYEASLRALTAAQCRDA